MAIAMKKPKSRTAVEEKILKDNHLEPEVLADVLIDAQLARDRAQTLARAHNDYTLIAEGDDEAAKANLPLYTEENLLEWHLNRSEYKDAKTRHEELRDTIEVSIDVGAGIGDLRE